MKGISGSSKRFFHIPYELSLAQRLFLVPYFGAGAIYNPERGDLVAGLGDATAPWALNKLYQRMNKSEEGRKLLREKPLVTEDSLDVIQLRSLPENTLGKQYIDYMDKHHFSADERSTVRFISNAEHAYVMTRYRQVHDFWHVLSGFPPTELGEIALKWFEFYHTGLPVCLLSGSLGPLRLSPAENHKLWQIYRPWAKECAATCKDLLTFPYEEHLAEDVGVLRTKLNFTPPPTTDC